MHQAVCLDPPLSNFPNLKNSPCPTGRCAYLPSVIRYGQFVSVYLSIFVCLCCDSQPTPPPPPPPPPPLSLSMWLRSPPHHCTSLVSLSLSLFLSLCMHLFVRACGSVCAHSSLRIDFRNDFFYCGCDACSRSCDISGCGEVGGSA